MNTKLIQTYTALILITLAALIIIDRAGIAYPLDITTSMRSSELSVVGEGKVEAVPDTATVTAGITVNRASSVDAAQSQVDSVNNAIIDAMKRLGIEEEDIKTSQYSVNPNYSYNERTQSIDGYNAQASVTIKTNDIDLVTQIVSDATSAGANQINGVSFSIDDPSSLREEARSKAIEDAKEQAKKLSRELGISLGGVTNIVEQSGGLPQPYFGKAEMAFDVAEASGPVVEPGSQEVSSTVTVYFEIR